MATPYNRIGALSGLDYSSLTSDPYFLAALQSYNPNFKASQTAQTEQTQQQTTNYSASNASNTSSIPVNYATTAPDKSNAGLWVSGAVGAAALIGLAAKGKGNPIKGFKALCEKFFKSGAAKTSEIISEKLSGIRVVRNGNKVECLVPGETTKITKHKDAMDHLRQYFGLSSTKDIFNVTKGESTLNGGTFVTKGGYEITFEGEKITKIKKGKKDLTSTYFGRGVKLRDDQKEFLERVRTKISEAQKMEKGWHKGFTTADVTRKLGDNTARITYGGKTPVIKELTTLKPVETTDDAVKAWAYDHPEAKILLNKDTFKSKDYKIPEGMKAADAKITSDGIVYHFENGEIVGITKGGKYYAKGKKECNVELVDKEDDIKTAYEQLISGNIEKKYRKMIDMKNVEINYVKA